MKIQRFWQIFTFMHATYEVVMAFSNNIGHSETACEQSYCDPCCLKKIKMNISKFPEINPETSGEVVGLVSIP